VANTSLLTIHYIHCTIYKKTIKYLVQYMKQQHILLVMNRVTYLSNSITAKIGVSPISSFRALHRGKATPMQTVLSLLLLSLSFFDNRPSAKRQGLFFEVQSTSAPLGRFFGFSAMLLLAALSSPLSCRCQVKPSRKSFPVRQHGNVAHRHQIQKE